MEEHSKTCKLFLFCESSSGLIPAMRSRCFTVRLPEIGQESMVSTAGLITKKLGIKIDDAVIAQLAEKANGNMRRFLLLL